MRAKQFIRKINEAADESSVITSEVIKLISDGHTEVSPDVITAKVSAALGRPFMLKDLVSANNNSPELQHYIDSINPSKIKFSTDILTVKNQDPMKEKQAAQDGVAKMAARAGSRPRLGESQGISQDEEIKFHKKLDTLVHDTFGKRKDEVEEGWGTGSDRVHLPDEPSTYWAGNGQLQDEYNRLYDELVPSQGKADTIEGEVLRASSKIVYRHYNDGDEFNQASFDQLEPYIGKVSSYDDLAHKAVEFAVKANGNYTPNPNWDSLDVMEYGPEEDDYDDYEEDDDYDDWSDDEEDEDEDLDEDGAGVRYGVYKRGGSIGERKGLIKTFDTKEEAQEYAKRQRRHLSPGERKYYKLGYTVKAVKPGEEVDEGWESGPEERAPRERDPDAGYDDMRQQKADAEAEKAQAQRPQKQVYTLVGRGPNYEPNYAFPGEYDSLDSAVAARAKLMADPNTPNPRDIGISKRTQYLDLKENRETPLRDREDYQAKKKALQDIQSDPSTSQDPELSTEVIRRLAGLKQQAKAMGLEESRKK